MQTWITDYDIAKSAANLDNKRLFAQIYEGIHILASLLGVNDRLVNPKRDVLNHPAAMLWKQNIPQLLNYIETHLKEWINRGYTTKINVENYWRCWNVLNLRGQLGEVNLPIPWITDDLIQTHRSVLIQKKPEHYRPLWPDCPGDLVMRYDWRER